MQTTKVTQADSGKPGHHFVQFYKDDEALLDEVADFMDGALRRGDAGVVIATPLHRQGLDRRLQGARDAVGAEHWFPGELIALDAEETLHQFMRAGWPDEDLFIEVVGGVLKRASRDGARSVRAFGEMVALLCERGQQAAAIRLEELWNILSTQQAFSLYCAYPLNLFTRDEDRLACHRVCTSHTHVLSSPTRVNGVSNAERDLVLTQLQQKSDVLDAEMDKRTRAEATLRMREKELADFLDNAAEGLSRIGPDGRVAWANRAELELLGLTREEVIDQPWWRFHADPEQGRHIAERMRAGETLYNEAVKLRCKDGTFRHVLVHTTPVMEDGQLQFTRCFTRDVTEQQQAREVLDRANDERARLLRELAAANRAKDEFLAMLGHELRNPLAPIVTTLRLMRMRDGSETLREQDVIQRQVDHLIRLVDDLLDVSKITRGKIELRKERADIGEVLTRAVEMASPLIEKRRHRLSVRLPDPPVAWVGDAVRLAQVVSNLLTNAARYTPEGGELALRARRDGRGVVISVRDNGIGIAPHMLGRVFDLFVQGERGKDRAEGGLGIGLALVKSLVHLHGGRVSVRSEGLGHGSEFIVQLPLNTVDVAPTPSSRMLSMPAAADGGTRVLLVDDNADAVEMLALAVSSIGHEVRVAMDPAAALQLVDSFKPDVAVLDIGLPVIDGYELAVRLRERLAGHPCRFIALTGYSQQSDRQRSVDAGFEQHLVKPVDVDELIALLAPTADALD
ncbi:hybrid sensor histidine kinase/response regulator [Piscinibacter terrae]|uniref:hybrid sensor histidine kinase/response regulator n=1 Tax=Piscinibacter terrae TaxID=2496871 RepID=UPI001F466F7E|nr:ATP-binding protein [Albitalea terrae]